MYGGLIDRLHDLLLCGVDPSMVDLSMCISYLQSEEGDSHAYRETEALMRAVSHPWIPSHHAFMYGPEFRACITSVCLVKVNIFDCLSLCVYSRSIGPYVCLIVTSLFFCSNLDLFVSPWVRWRCWCFSVSAF